MPCLKRKMVPFHFWIADTAGTKASVVCAIESGDLTGADEYGSGATWDDYLMVGTVTAAVWPGVGRPPSPRQGPPPCSAAPATRCAGWPCGPTAVTSPCPHRQAEP